MIGNNNEGTEILPRWVCAWRSPVFDETVSHLAFSADGSYFASCESDDHLVRVWFEDICCEYIIIVLFTFIFGFTKLRKILKLVLVVNDTYSFRKYMKVIKFWDTVIPENNFNKNNTLLV